MPRDRAPGVEAPVPLTVAARLRHSMGRQRPSPLKALCLVVFALISVTVSASCGHSASRSLHRALSAKSPSVGGRRAAADELQGSVDAEATVPAVAVYAAPGASRPDTVLPNPWLLNGERDKPIAQVFLVSQQQSDGWLQVLLPSRPNGTHGWVRASDVKLTRNPYLIHISIATHQIRVSNGPRVMYQGAVATGSAVTPTPPGEFYIRVLLQSTDPTSVYGPYAYGLSAHSDALTEFDGGDAEIGLHGNNDPTVLGTGVTHGCIRMDNSAISRMAPVLPLGTPVTVTA